MRSRSRHKKHNDTTDNRKPFFGASEMTTDGKVGNSFFEPNVLHRKAKPHSHKASQSSFNESSSPPRKKQQIKDSQQDFDDSMELISSRFSGDPILEACLRNEQFLKIGSSGAAVAKVQQALVDAGFSLENYGVDGHFGQETQTTVKAFQRASGFVGAEVDGIVGRKTLGKLDNSFGKASTKKTIDNDRKDKLKHYSIKKKAEAIVRTSNVVKDNSKPFPHTDQHSKEPKTVNEANELLTKANITTEQRQWLYNFLIKEGWAQAAEASAEIAAKGIIIHPIRGVIVKIALGEIGRVETLRCKKNNPPEKLSYTDKSNNVHNFEFKNTRVGSKRLQEYFEIAAPKKMDHNTFNAIHDCKVKMHKGDTNKQGLARWCGIFALWVHIAAGNTTHDWGKQGEGAPWPTAGHPKNIQKGGQFETVALHKSGNDPKSPWLSKVSEIPKPGDVLNNGNHYGIVIKASRKTVTFVDGNQGVMRSIRLRTESWSGSEWQIFYRAVAAPR